MGFTSSKVLAAATHPGRKKLVAAVAISALALSLAACGSETPSGANSNPGALQTIRVGASASLSSASLHVGLNEGTFEAAGIKVEISPITSMSEGVTQVMSGNLDYIFGDVHNTILAQAESMPIVMAAPVAIGATKAPADNMGFGNLLVLKDKSIKTAKDLEGKTIATSSLNGTGRLDMETVLKRAGVDVSGLKWVAVAGPQQMAALRQGQVDAATIPEPSASKAMLDGDVISVISGDDALPGAPLYGMIATTKWIAEHKDAAAKFSGALIEANKVTNNDRDIVNKTIASYTDLSPEVIEKLRLPQFAEEQFQPDEVTSTMDRLAEFNLLKPEDAPDLNGLFQNF